MAGYFTTIYVLAVDKNVGGNRNWFWDRTEAEQAYEEAVDQVGDTATVSLYATDVQQAIDDYLDEAMELRSTISGGPLDELRSNRGSKLPPKPEYSDIMPDVSGESLYIERTVSPDYWPFKITKTRKNAWTVRDMTTGDRIGAIYQEDPDALMPEYIGELEAGTPIGSRSSLQKAVEMVIEQRLNP